MNNPDTHTVTDFSAQKESLKAKFQADIDALEIAESKKMITDRTEGVLLEMLASDDAAMVSESRTAIHRLYDCAEAFINFLDESSIIFDTILGEQGQELYLKLIDLVNQEGPNKVEELRQFLDENTQAFPENYKGFLKDAIEKYEADLSQNLIEFNELPLLQAALAKQPIT